MSGKGLKVLLNMLGGNKDTVEAIATSIGKIIKKVWLDKETNRLIFSFEDESSLHVWDDGQTCCEERFMVSDDDLNYYSEARLLDFKVKSVPETEDDWCTHEIQFLDVKTSKGVFQIANHNVHNGYYGGFAIEASLNKMH